MANLMFILRAHCLLQVISVIYIEAASDATAQGYSELKLYVKETPSTLDDIKDEDRLIKISRLEETDLKEPPKFQNTKRHASSKAPNNQQLVDDFPPQRPFYYYKSQLGPKSENKDNSIEKKHSGDKIPDASINIRTPLTPTDYNKRDQEKILSQNKKASDPPAYRNPYTVTKTAKTTTIVYKPVPEKREHKDRGTSKFNPEYLSQGKASGYVTYSLQQKKTDDAPGDYNKVSVVSFARRPGAIIISFSISYNLRWFIITSVILELLLVFLDIKLYNSLGQ